MVGADVFHKISSLCPLVHCIERTENRAVCADVLASVGARCITSNHTMEVKEITSACDVLVCNIAAGDSTDAMLLAGRRSSEMEHPIVLSIEGIDISNYRKSNCLKFIETAKPACIIGTSREFAVLGEFDSPSENDFKKLAKKYDCIIAETGKNNNVYSGDNIYEVRGGTFFFDKFPEIQSIIAVMIAVFATVDNNFTPEHAAMAIRTVNYVGEVSEKAALKGIGGLMIFKQEFVNLLSILSDERCKPVKRRK